MFWISRIANKKDIYNIINIYIYKLLEQCHFFVIKDSDDFIKIPTIGDISPDFPVEWIISVPYSKIANEIYDNYEIRNSKNGDYGWAPLMDRLLKLYPTAQ